MAKPETIKCPVCSRETEWEGNPYRPFCSERCGLLDLGQWADERYAIRGRRSEDRCHGHPSQVQRVPEEEG
ncbi:MAG: DNA gyrase inhibitor YacG [Thermodesulfobacteriota bacterium]